MSRRDTARGWWQAREPRERLMLGIMGAALTAFALWLGVLRPVQAWAEIANERRLAADADLLEARTATAAIVSLQANRPTPPVGDAFATVVLDIASAAGVPVSSRRSDGDGTLTVGIDAVAPVALFTWLDTLHRQHGLVPSRLDVRERNGQLQVEASFASPEPRTGG